MIAIAAETQTFRTRRSLSILCRVFSQTAKLIDEIGLILADDAIRSDYLGKRFGKARDFLGGPLGNCSHVLIDRCELRPHSANLVRQLCQLLMRRHGRKESLPLESNSFVLNVDLNYIQLRWMEVLVGPSRTHQNGQSRSHHLCQFGGSARQIDFASTILYVLRLEDDGKIRPKGILKELQSSYDFTVFSDHRCNSVRPKRSNGPALMANGLDEREMRPRFQFLQCHSAARRRTAGVTVFDNAEGICKISHSGGSLRPWRALMKVFRSPRMSVKLCVSLLSMRFTDRYIDTNLDFFTRVDLRKSLLVRRVKNFDRKRNLWSRRGFSRCFAEQPSQEFQTESPSQKLPRINGKLGNLVASSCLLGGDLGTGEPRSSLRGLAIWKMIHSNGSQR
jgi:hypothetical protein